MIGIYKITNIVNGKSYIGQSTDIIKRWKEHINSSPSKLLYVDFIQFGLNNFTFSILEICSPELLNEKEKYWIKYYDSNNFYKGYNLTIGGEGRQSKSQKQEIKKQLLEEFQMIDNSKKLSLINNQSIEDFL